MSDRPKRRSALRRTNVPDATHYVGYVEDEETPEMIMKKFEEMERIRAAYCAKQNSPLRPTGNDPASDSAGPSSATATAAAAAAADPLPAEAATDVILNQEQLQAIFKATSMFNVRSLLGHNQVLMVAESKEQPNRGVLSDAGPDTGEGGALADCCTA
jgi:hypothetical protein